MCTAIAFNSNDRYFGRNLDIECSYDEKIIVIPQNYSMQFRFSENCITEKAIMGIGIIVDEIPLFYDAINQSGLCIAALRYPCAKYSDTLSNGLNLTSYELIPYFLSHADTIDDIYDITSNLSISSAAFSHKLPPSPLHWMICDKNSSVVLECETDGIKLHDNPVEVLTNMPDFEKQMFNLNNYRNLSAFPSENKFSDKIILEEYSYGMGAIGLPGDLSSMSRFVRVAFTKSNAETCFEKKDDEISQFFSCFEFSFTNTWMFGNIKWRV